MALPFAGAQTRMACWEERPQVCGEIRLALAEVRRRSPLAGLRGTPVAPRPMVHGTAAGAPPPPPPPLPGGSEEMRYRSSTTYYPQAVRQSVADVALPTAPRR